MMTSESSHRDRGGLRLSTKDSEMQYLSVPACRAGPVDPTVTVRPSCQAGTWTVTLRRVESESRVCQAESLRCWLTTEKSAWQLQDLIRVSGCLRVSTCKAFVRRGFKALLAMATFQRFGTAASRVITDTSDPRPGPTPPVVVLVFRVILELAYFRVI